MAEGLKAFDVLFDDRPRDAPFLALFLGQGLDSLHLSRLGKEDRCQWRERWIGRSGEVRDVADKHGHLRSEFKNAPDLRTDRERASLEVVPGLQRYGSFSGEDDSKNGVRGIPRVLRHGQDGGADNCPVLALLDQETLAEA